MALLAVVEIKFTSLANVARLRHIQNLCGFSTPTAMGQSFIMTLYILTLEEYLHETETPLSLQYTKKNLTLCTYRLGVLCQWRIVSS
jgi:hypothetical protein